MSDFDETYRENHDGSERRDPEVARLLAGSPVPDHGPSFWADLSARVGAETNGGPVTDRSNTGRLPTVVDQPDASEQPTVVELAPQRNERRRRRPALLLAAAALIAVVGVGLFVALSSLSDQDSIADIATDGSGDNGSQDGGRIEADTAETDKAETDTAETDKAEADEDAAAEENADDGTGSGTDAGNGSNNEEPGRGDQAPAVDYSNPVQLNGFSTGRALGTSPDGSTILLVDTYTEQPSTGCEGGQTLMLYGHDLETGERRPLLPDGVTVETGGLQLWSAEAMMSRSPDPSGSVTVLLADYCDGVRNRVWSATMAAAGDVSDLRAIEPDSQEDPFRANTVSADMADGMVSADGVYRIERDNDRLEVHTTGQVWVFRGEVTSPWTARFTPSGNEVVVNDGELTIIWQYRTGEFWTIPTGPVAGYRFAGDGNYLFVNYLFDEPEFALINFGGDRPPATGQVDNCSGVADLGQLQVPDRLPPAVAETLAAIDAAAQSCDFETLVNLAGDSFQLGFGGDDPRSAWPDGERNGFAPMLELRQLLRTPVAIADPEATTGPTVFQWPAAAAKDCEDLTEEDRFSMERLNVSQDELDSYCDAFGSYAGIRTGFTDNGEWLYLVSGD